MYIVTGYFVDGSTYSNTASTEAELRDVLRMIDNSAVTCVPERIERDGVDVTSNYYDIR